MGNNSVVDRQKGSHFAIVRDEYTNFCEGNKCAAMVISYFEGWHNSKKQLQESLQGMKNRGEYNGDIEKTLWQYQSLKAIEIGISSMYKRETISIALKYLIDKEVLFIMQGSSINGVAKTYLFNPEPINAYITKINAQPIDFSIGKNNDGTDRKIEGTDRKIDTTKNIIRTKEESSKGKDSLLLSETTNVVSTVVLKTNGLTRRKPSIYGSSIVKEIFDYWNDLETNQPCKILHRHRPDINCKTFNKSILAINLALTKYHPKIIKQAMSDYLDLLYDRNSIFYCRTNLVGCKVDLWEFFKFSYKTKERMHADSLLKGSKSWFLECLNGYDQLLSKFAKYEKDDNPKITEAIKRSFSLELARKNFTVADENCFIKAAKVVLSYHEKNKHKINWNSCLQEKDNPSKFAYRLVEAVIEDTQDLSMIEATWLCTLTTLNVRLPKYMKKRGLLSSESVNMRSTNISKGGYNPGYAPGEIE